MKLNWKDRSKTCTEARAAREIGGRFRLRRRHGNFFEVEWLPDRRLPSPWFGVGETREEAKALAQQAHDQARRAISRMLAGAKAVARETLKRAPWATEDYRQRHEKALERLCEFMRNKKKDAR